MGELGMDMGGRPDLDAAIRELLDSAPDRPDVEMEIAKIYAAAEREGVLDPQLALDLAHRRATGCMLPQILGRTSFMGQELLFEPGVCAVREETELLGWTAVERLREMKKERSADSGPLRLIEIGSGAGNLTCGIAKAVPEVQVWAIDLERACTALTAKNVERLGLAGQVSVLEGDMFAPIEALGLRGRIDAIVSNPPYIASTRLLKDKAYLLDHEPRAAFDGGPFGINIQLRLIKEALPFLRAGGWLLFEFGAGQHHQVGQLVQRTGGYDMIEFVSDPAGQPRVSANRKGL